MPDDNLIRNLEHLTGGLAARLRSLVIAQDRLDRLESGSGRWRDGFAETELHEAAAGMTLRALHTVSDPATFAILRSLSAAESHSLPALIAESGTGRVTLSERLNDLVQVGLAARLIDTDQAQITAAGAAMVWLVEQLVAGTERQFLARSNV